MKFGPPILGDDEPGVEPCVTLVIKNGVYPDLSGVKGRARVIREDGKLVMTLLIPTRRMSSCDEDIAFIHTIDQCMNDLARAFTIEGISAGEFVEAARRAAGLIV